MWTSCVFLLLGGWARSFQGSEGNGYWVLIISQILAGIGLSFDYGNTSKVALTWFQKKE